MDVFVAELFPGLDSALGGVAEYPVGEKPESAGVHIVASDIVGGEEEVAGGGAEGFECGDERGGGGGEDLPGEYKGLIFTVPN